MAQEPRRPDPERTPFSPPTTRRSVNGPIAMPPTRRVENAPPRGAADPGQAVNPFSRAVNPKQQYPLHFDLLMRDMYSRGMVPEQWQVVAADEVRLDENGMDVEFTLLEPKINRLWRRRVDVEHGKLLRIVDY